MKWIRTTKVDKLLIQDSIAALGIAVVIGGLIWYSLTPRGPLQVNHYRSASVIEQRSLNDHEIDEYLHNNLVFDSKNIDYVELRKNETHFLRISKDENSYKIQWQWWNHKTEVDEFHLRSEKAMNYIVAKYYTDVSPPSSSEWSFYEK